MAPESQKHRFQVLAFKNVTIKEVAEHCGLSVVTVSHVLNAGRAASFRPATVEKIQSAAEKLGYRRNASARAMRLGCTDQIALIAPRAHHRGQLMPPLVDGILDALDTTQPRVHLLIGETGEDEWAKNSDLPDIVRHRLVDGLLINYHKAVRSQAESIRRLSIPAIFLNANLRRDALLPDDRTNAFDLTEHLIASGRKRVAYFDLFSPLPANAHYSRGERVEGYEAAMVAHGKTPRIHLWEGGAEHAGHPDFPRQKLEELFQGTRRPDAVVCYGNQSLFACMSVASRLGLRLPEDLLLATFETEDLSKSGLPVVTSILPFYEIGRQAVQSLLALISKQEKQMTSRRFKAQIRPPLQP